MTVRLIIDGNSVYEIEDEYDDVKQGDSAGKTKEDRVFQARRDSAKNWSAENRKNENRDTY